MFLSNMVEKHVEDLKGNKHKSFSQDLNNSHVEIVIL